MQKSGIVKILKIAIKNVGLGSALSLFLMTGNAFAASEIYPQCADCYRCSLPLIGGGCPGRCIYDTNYCMEIECPLGKIMVDGECICEILCEGIQNPDTCECSGCESGSYVARDACKTCPSADFSGAVDGTSCAISSDNNGFLGVTDCYVRALAGSGIAGGNSCKYSDNSGSFMFTQDCHYSGISDSGSTDISGTGNEDVEEVIIGQL